MLAIQPCVWVQGPTAFIQTVVFLVCSTALYIYLAQGYFNMQTRGSGDHTTDFLIGGSSILLLEPHPPP